MTNEQYAVLIEELRNDPLEIGYSTLSDEDVAKKLNEQTYSVPTTRFITWRAIAAVLDDDEYAAVKAALNQLAQASPKVADMLPFLEMPCDDSGTTGGDAPLNFGYSSMSAEEILAAVVLLGYSGR